MSLTNVFQFTLQRTERRLSSTQTGIQLFEQIDIVRQRALKNRSLLTSSLPISSFDGFCQTGQFEMCIGETRAVEDVLEPWPAGDSVGIEPVALDLHHSVVDRVREFGIKLAGGQRSCDRID